MPLVSSLRLSVGHPHAPEDRDDLLAAAFDGAEPHRAVALEAGYVIVRCRCLGRSLVGRALDAKYGSETMQLVGVVGHQVAPAMAGPLPDRRIDVDCHQA